MNASTLSDRIRHARKTARLTQAQVAAALDIKREAVAQWESTKEGGRTAPSRENLAAFAKLTNAPMNWLHDDSASLEGLTAEGRNLEFSRTATTPGYIRFHMMDGQAAGGGGVVNQDYPAVLREIDIAEWQVRSQIGFIPDKGRVQLITIRGDSMYPDIKNGDVVMVDTARSHFDGDGVYLINLNGYTMVKRLQMLPNGLHIVSTNPKYQSSVLPAGELDTLHVAGRIVGGALMRRGEEF
ncbi:phage repressor protein C with HTH and peptisase S24 domain [Stenotrophomonas rhizophila]|uniref:Phage repressor protein C with HTH and peptisase S24 domain n=1 Tax=Stenotrophomonas rhizophila TaxID=216778 RepID=A0A498CNP7_9GAMM|nr:S24 family peptidase [Stenotrophomonas rhizophila]RLK53421.1 phage repressor protein C with HTH and peptisase S24 domain [Stenotrophomonas rhizophila]